MIVGLSGGVDSCYTLHLMRNLQYMELIAVTFDNGWDNPVATHNAEMMVKSIGIQHRIYSMDLYEFREIQRAFLLSSTPHAECPTDVAIKKSLLNALDEYKADRIVSGSNRLEGNPPAHWSVVDGLYVKDVMKKHGRIKLRTFPNLSLRDHFRFNRFCYKPLNEIAYDPKEARKLLIEEYGWKDYGTKHYESIYTKWNQGLRYFKFGIDMRTIEVDHNYDLSKPPYGLYEFHRMSYDVGKKLDLDMDKIMAMPPRDWKEYKSYRKWILKWKSMWEK